jgi:hypothetical protein
MVEDPADYRWSSYEEAVGHDRGPEALACYDEQSGNWGSSFQHKQSAYENTDTAE